MHAMLVHEIEGDVALPQVIEMANVALQLAQSQNALSLELRCANSLAKLSLYQGDVQTARHLLNDVGGKLTGGLDTYDA